jgi:diadenylate cyclase
VSLSDLWFTLSQINARAVIDILLVALIFWGFLRLIQGTQAVQLLRGVILVVLAAVVLTSVLRLTAFSFLISKTLPALVLAIPVIFQPELRRALERLGRAGGLTNRQYAEPVAQYVINSVARAAVLLSDRRHGALVVLERSTGLQEYIDTGVRLDSLVTPELLLTIFYPNTALHDGAVVIQGDRVVAAGCVLPLSTGATLDYLLGTRHRAALGVTEQTDAVVVVVSEETGIISVAYNGRIIRRLDENRLTKVLQAIYVAEAPQVTTARRLARRLRSFSRRVQKRANDALQRITFFHKGPAPK